MQQWNDSVKRYNPVRARLIRDTNVSGAKLQGFAGASLGNTAGAGQQALSRGLAQNTQIGIAPGSGRSVMGLGARINAIAATSGIGEGNAVVGARAAETQGMMKIARYGRGMADSSRISLASGVNRAATTSALNQRLQTQKNNWVNTGLGQLTGGYLAGRKLFANRAATVKPAVAPATKPVYWSTGV